MHFKAFLFDMDGVVIDSQAEVERFWHIVAQKYSVKLTQADFEQHIYGCPAVHTLDHLFQHLKQKDREEVEAFMYEFEKDQRYKEIAGVTEFLRQLSRLGMPTALVTSAEHAKVREVFKQLEMTDLFDVTISVADIKRGKPHPDCYLAAADKLRLSPEECVVFEDSISGTEAAVAAGSFCIGVQANAGMAEQLKQKGARLIIQNFMGLDPQQLLDIHS